MITTRRNQILAFAFLCVAAIFLWRHAVVATVGLALVNDAYTHILLIVPLSAALIYADFKTLRIDGRPSYGWGVALFIAALLIAGYARWGTVAAREDIR